MKRNPQSGYTLIEMLVILIILSILAAIIFPVFNRSHCNAHQSSCQSNLKQLGLAMLQYTQDYDERMTPVALNAVASSLTPYARPYGWADALLPYCKSTQIFQCPSEKSASSEDATQPGFTDYWFNTNLNARPQKEISPVNTFLLGEGNAAGEITDARYARRALPRAWLDNPESPAQRHDKAANYLFLDGHAKTYSPQLVLQVLAEGKLP